MKNKLSTFARVRELQGPQAIAFGVTLLERMLPNYTLFAEVSEFGDARQFRNTLNSVWEYLSSPQSKINFAVQLEKIELAIPDSADFDMYGVYPAIDTGMSMAALLLLILGDDPQGAVVVSKLSQGSVEAAIEAANGASLSDEQIRQHPLMQWEIAFQLEVLARLEQQTVNSVLCKTLKALAVAEGMSNIGIEMD